MFNPVYRVFWYAGADSRAGENEGGGWMCGRKGVDPEDGTSVYVRQIFAICGCGIGIKTRDKDLLTLQAQALVQGLDKTVFAPKELILGLAIRTSEQCDCTSKPCDWPSNSTTHVFGEARGPEAIGNHVIVSPASPPHALDLGELVRKLSNRICENVYSAQTRASAGRGHGRDILRDAKATLNPTSTRRWVLKFLSQPTFAHFLLLAPSALIDSSANTAPRPPISTTLHIHHAGPAPSTPTFTSPSTPTRPAIDSHACWLISTTIDFCAIGHFRTVPFKALQPGLTGAIFTAHFLDLVATWSFCGVDSTGLRLQYCILFGPPTQVQVFNPGPLILQLWTTSLWRDCGAIDNLIGLHFNPQLFALESTSNPLTKFAQELSLKFHCPELDTYSSPFDARYLLTTSRYYFDALVRPLTPFTTVLMICGPFDAPHLLTILDYLNVRVHFLILNTIHLKPTQRLRRLEFNAPLYLTQVAADSGPFRTHLVFRRVAKLLNGDLFNFDSLKINSIVFLGRPNLWQFASRSSSTDLWGDYRRDCLTYLGLPVFLFKIFIGTSTNLDFKSFTAIFQPFSPCILLTTVSLHWAPYVPNHPNSHRYLPRRICEEIIVKADLPRRPNCFIQDLHRHLNGLGLQVFDRYLATIQSLYSTNHGFTSYVPGHSNSHRYVVPSAHETLDYPTFWMQLVSTLVYACADWIRRAAILENCGLDTLRTNLLSYSTALELLWRPNLLREFETSTSEGVTLPVRTQYSNTSFNRALFVYFHLNPTQLLRRPFLSFPKLDFEFNGACIRMSSFLDKFTNLSTASECAAPHRTQVTLSSTAFLDSIYALSLSSIKLSRPETTWALLTYLPPDFLEQIESTSTPILEFEVSPFESAPNHLPAWYRCETIDPLQTLPAAVRLASFLSSDSPRANRIPQLVIGASTLPHKAPGRRANVHARGTATQACPRRLLAAAAQPRRVRGRDADGVHAGRRVRGTSALGSGGRCDDDGGGGEGEGAKGRERRGGERGRQREREMRREELATGKRVHTASGAYDSSMRDQKHPVAAGREGRVGRKGEDREEGGREGGREEDVEVPSRRYACLSTDSSNCADLVPGRCSVGCGGGWL
ncbi:hypothetical protein B0H16DRAFT_1471953 [Mycena metata]|uniref:Uncharacterized protein n=1 Tax=Mycena metata TaxID=1033252 RepID=A0AAD7HQH4_9AGAR|nr:hypothetical protein B0H16DRAFT_1471953 [Mycena metata]